MDNRTRNIFLAIAAVLLVAVIAYGGFNGWFQGPTGPSGPRGLQGRQGSAGEVVVTEVITEGSEESEPAAECPQARELGPWAPNNGAGETFEVTANETVSSGVHVQLWWPAGSGQDWGTQEISTFLEPGLSIEVQDGAGRGWEYALSCLVAEIQAQMDADHARRQTDTSYWGFVDIDDLIATGLVVVRFDRR